MDQKDSQMKSWKIQNEIINCKVDCVRKEIIKQIQDFKHYAIIADEVTDRYSNKEILFLCIRYLNCTKECPAIEEVFLASTHISGRPTGENIGQHILDLLDSHGIMIEDCCGQAYDGASAMSNAVKGASAVIKEKSHWPNSFTVGVIVQILPSYLHVKMMLSANSWMI